VTTPPVRTPSRSDLALADLGAELTPVKSLARVDAVTARVVTNVSVIGVLLTGLGAFAAGLPSFGGPARALAIAAVITATLAVASALAAQILTITRHINPANLAQVRAWYRRRIDTRAYPTQAATVLLLISAVTAGTAGAIALTSAHGGQPALTVSQTLDPADGSGATASAGVATVTLTVAVTFRGLTAGQAATIVITTAAASHILASAAVTPAPDGTAASTLTVNRVAAASQVTISVTAGHQHCQATLDAAEGQPALTCAA